MRLNKLKKIKPSAVKDTAKAQSVVVKKTADEDSSSEDSDQFGDFPQLLHPQQKFDKE